MTTETHKKLKINSICHNCCHKQVCKYENEIDIFIRSTDIPNILRCKYFYEPSIDEIINGIDEDAEL